MNIGPAIGNAPNYGLNGLLTNGQPNWTIIETLDWVQPMKTCPQEAIYHAEGDVWTHTCMVVEALLNDVEFKQLGNPALP